ncbi:MAG: acyltransferase [Lachnospiraceae bacterium]|nr:acyltransferase [Candidatus Merdinaster equi]
MNENRKSDDNGIDKDYLSADKVLCMKGVFAIGVLLHHLFQYSGIVKWGTMLGNTLQALGYLSVGMFFFYSGYGLKASSEKEGYVKSFLPRRLLPLYIFYVVLIGIYYTWSLICGYGITSELIVRSFFFGETIVRLGWFLQVTFVLYLLFWTIFSLCKSNRLRIGLMLLALVSYSVICNLLGLDSIWYEGIYCFWFGILWHEYRKKIDKAFMKCFFGVLGAFIILFVFFFILQYKMQLVFVYKDVFKIISAIMFACMINTFSYIFRNTRIIDNVCLKFLGRNSIGLYVSQGLFLMMRSGTNIHIDDAYIFVIITVLGSLLVGFFVTALYRGIVKIIRRICKI